MELSVCKACNHFVFQTGNKILCGFRIDPVERKIVDREGEKVITECPRDKSA